MSKKLNGLAAEIISRLKAEGIVIQRYDAYSTNSIYLKLDYGVSNSIRISDHGGKKHLAYRYNLLTSCSSPYSDVTDGLPRYFFPAGWVSKMIEKILADRGRKLEQYGRGKYKELMMQNMIANDGKRGFWAEAVLV